MRFLCVCHAITPFLTPVLRQIAAQPENFLIIAQGRQKKGSEIPGARNVKLKRPEIRKMAQGVPAYWEIAAQFGKCAMQSFETIAQSGFIPDVILEDSLSGTTLGLGEVFPSAFTVAYLEKASRGNAAERRFRRQLRAIQIMESDVSYNLGGAEESATKVRWGPFSVNAALFQPMEGNPSREGWPEIVFCLHGLSETELERWLATACEISRDRKIFILLPDTEIARKLAAMKIGDGIPYAWNIPDGDAARLFGHAGLIAWPAREIAPELLAAMSCGKAIAAHEIGPFLAPGQNCLGLRENGLPDDLSGILRDDELLARMGKEARRLVLEKFDAAKIVPAHVEEIISLFCRKWESGRSS